MYSRLLSNPVGNAHSLGVCGDRGGSEIDEEERVEVQHALCRHYSW